MLNIRAVTTGQDAATWVRSLILAVFKVEAKRYHQVREREVVLIT
jgi:hypothetical protein